MKNQFEGSYEDDVMAIKGLYFGHYYERGLYRVKLDPRMVAEVHRRAAKAAIEEFRTANYVPKLARDRKTSIDTLLMGYKKINPDFCYIVRNGQRDLKVLIKRKSEGNFLPYRNISLEVLGRLSPLKTQTADPRETEEPEEAAVESDGYQKQGRRSRKPSFTPKETIYCNITVILDGFKIQQNQNGQ